MKEKVIISYGMPVVLLCLFLQISLPVSAKADLGRYPTPSWLQFNEVAQNLVINGLPSEAYYFTGNRDMEETLNFYRKQWRKHPDYSPGYRETIIPEWHIIARAEGSILLTIQLDTRSPHQSNGYFAIADLEELTQPNLSTIPMLPGSNVLNQSNSSDYGKDSSVVMVSNNSSVTVNADFYTKYYTSRGWSNDTSHVDTYATTLIFRNSRQEVNLVIKELFGATQTVINTVDR